MDKRIVVKRKNVYGNVLTYPVCDMAKMLCELTGNKTLTLEAIAIIQNLGFEIELEKEKF